MKILGIESAAVTASVAIVTEDVVLAEYTINHKKTHSQTLLPMIDEICRMTETDPSELDAVAVSNGPGSFTGLRIGAATAKGIGLALHKPLIPVPTVDAIAYQAYGYEGVICPLMDARRDQVYTGLYTSRGGAFTVCLPQGPRAIDEILREIDDRFPEERILFLGEGVPIHRALLEERLGDRADIAPSFAARERAAAVAALGLKYYQAGKAVPGADLAPEYMRPSQAERVREEKRAEEAWKASEAAREKKDGAPKP